MLIVVLITGFAFLLALLGMRIAVIAALGDVCSTGWMFAGVNGH